MATLIKEANKNSDQTLTHDKLAAITKYGLVVYINQTDHFNTMPRLNGIKCATVKSSVTMDNCNGSKSDDFKDDDNNDSNTDNNNVAMLLCGTSSNICAQGFDCPIYKKVKNNYEYNKSNYKHISELNHFNFDYNSKPQCRYGLECKAFKRVARMNEDKNNFNCHRCDDLCHLCIYRHPPRIDRNNKIMENNNSIINKINENMNPFTATSEAEGFGTHASDIDSLILEVIDNGFEKDLCLNSNDLVNKQYTLLKIVNQKLQSKIFRIRYKNSGLVYDKYHDRRSKMLSLLLYTGCECNYDLCKHQRNGNYEKWHEFDDHLHSAISDLHWFESYSDRSKQLSFSFHLYSGLNNVQLKNKKKIDLFYFNTYVSTSYDKSVSMQFAKNNGMLLQFDQNVIAKKQFKCCSLEWISKFPNECEVLIARSKGCDADKAATLTVMDYQMSQNTNKNNNNKSNININGNPGNQTFQIVNVQHFKSLESNSNTTLLSQYQMDYWQWIFSNGENGKNTLLTKIDQASIDYFNTNYLQNLQLSDVVYGINLLYNDNTFKQYCDKFAHNVYSSKLNQFDIIEMQKRSKVLKYYIDNSKYTIFPLACCMQHSGKFWKYMKGMHYVCTLMSIIACSVYAIVSLVCVFVYFIKNISITYCCDEDNNDEYTTSCFQKIAHLQSIYGDHNSQQS